MRKQSIFTNLLVLPLLLLTAAWSSQAAVREVSAIGLTVGDLDRELEFFTKVRRALAHHRLASRARAWPRVS